MKAILSRILRTLADRLDPSPIEALRFELCSLRADLRDETNDIREQLEANDVFNTCRGFEELGQDVQILGNRQECLTERLEAMHPEDRASLAESIECIRADILDFEERIDGFESWMGEGVAGPVERNEERISELESRIESLDVIEDHESRISELETYDLESRIEELESHESESFEERISELSARLDEAIGVDAGHDHEERISELEAAAPGAAVLEARLERLEAEADKGPETRAVVAQLQGIRFAAEDAVVGFLEARGAALERARKASPEVFSCSEPSKPEAKMDPLGNDLETILEELL